MSDDRPENRRTDDRVTDDGRRDEAPRRAPPPAFDFHTFMPELEVEEPDWVHDRAQGGDPERADPADLKEKIIDNLSLIYDPEIPVNIYDLGLVYAVEVAENGDAHVLMTLTAPNCPVAGSLPQMVERGVGRVPGVAKVTVELTWEPAWSLDRSSEDARLILGM
ncbi:MAG: DUF59 domain-containing protein [Azospirillaceae bacterium]